MSRYFIILITFLYSMVSIAQETNEQTKIMVRAQAKDAKFIGGSMGSARIVITDVKSGKILAEGLTEGSTGETELIMTKPIERNSRISTEETAGFLAEIDLSKASLVKIEAFAPLNYSSSIAKASTEMWLIPGKDILGDGVVLEIPGFVVEIINAEIKATENSEFNIEANIVMMCGCPTTSGGMWDADQYEVKAIFTNAESKETQEIALKPTGETSRFSSTSSIPKGNYNLLVYAFDPVTGNSGVAEKELTIN